MFVGGLFKVYNIFYVYGFTWNMWFPWKTLPIHATMKLNRVHFVCFPPFYWHYKYAQSEVQDFWYWYASCFSLLCRVIVIRYPFMFFFHVAGKNSSIKFSFIHSFIHYLHMMNIYNLFGATAESVVDVSNSAWLSNSKNILNNPVDYAFEKLEHSFQRSLWYLVEVMHMPCMTTRWN